MKTLANWLQKRSSDLGQQKLEARHEKQLASAERRILLNAQAISMKTSGSGGATDLGVRRARDQSPIRQKIAAMIRMISPASSSF